MERTAKVIDKQHPLYGMLCTVGPLVEQSDVHYITAVDEPWHSSYARDSQLEFEETLVSILIDGEALSDDQRVEMYAGDDIRIIQTAMIAENTKPNAEIRLDAKAATKLYDFLLLHMDRIHRAAEASL